MASAPAALAPAAAAAATPLDAASAAAAAAIEVAGGPAGARATAEDAAAAYLREAAPGQPASAARAIDPVALAQAVARRLVEEGWGNGEIEAEIDSTSVSGWRARLTLRGLEPARLSSWEWVGSDDPPDGPRPGLWEPEHRGEEISRLLEEVQEDGHPLASIQILEAGGDGTSMRVRARLHDGPRLRLTGLAFEGAGGTRDSYLARISGLRVGDPIRVEEAREARERIERSGLFRQVDGPYLRRAGESGGVLVYRLVPQSQNRIDGALGYDGKSRTMSGYLEVGLGNLFGTGRSAAASWRRLTRDRSALSLAYREPFLANLPVAADASLSQEVEDSTWSSDQARLGLEGDLGSGFFARAGLAARRNVASGIDPYRTSIVSTILGLGHDGLRESATRGDRAVIEIERGDLHRSPRRASGEGTLLRTVATAEENFPAGRSAHLRLEVEGGWIEGPDSLPRPDAFDLGGSAGLRGYEDGAFRALRYGRLRVEPGIRILPEGNRLYLFADGAFFRAWPGGTGKTEQRWGYGAGVRVRGAGGWIRLDYGIPKGEPPLAGRLHFRLETRF
ncbi:MAG: BamA/TamA family outer membrane protein [Candidatus Eisenbacteria bacterium]